MALNSRGSIDPRWIYHNRNAVRALELAEVEIYNPATGSQTYNPVTNDFTGSKTAIYTGRARIQPTTAATDLASDYNPTALKMVRVQVSYGRNELVGATEEMPDIRPNDRMIVTSAPYNTSLEKFLYTVMDVLNSSNSWERTLVCRVDSELDPTEI